ncbi:MAG: hypothetical protein D4S01_10130 [Dehalococcoidia bacterium]|nr:MAG: hypothetical protein D4S01_10130 [Dehalococcoidia bacterium]
MKATPRQLIQQAIQAFRDDDDASDVGSYRDVITEVLHMFVEDVCVRYHYTMDGELYPEAYPLIDVAWSVFVDEKRNAELEKVNNIKVKDLPLHIHDSFEFPVVYTYLLKRLERGE